MVASEEMVVLQMEVLVGRVEMHLPLKVSGFLLVATAALEATAALVATAALPMAAFSV
jgi:hypothetical protein